MKKILLILTLAISQSISGQYDAKHSVYFLSGKVEPSERELSNLNAWIDSILTIPSVSIVQIDLAGYCDSIGSKSANLILSRKRADALQNIFLKRLANVSINISAQGEDNPKYNNREVSGRSKNRRVDINVSLNKTNQNSTSDLHADKSAENQKNKQEEKSCDQDTILKYPQGTQIKLNKCDYEKYFKNCPIKITEYLDIQSMSNAGLSTRSDRGEQLTTGGMFKVTWCKNEKFPVELEISVPNSPCLDPSLQLYQWTLDESTNSWQNTNRLFERSQKEDGRLTTFIQSPGFFNCDAVITQSPSPVKFIAKDGLKIKNLRVLYSCPNPSIYENQLSDKKSNRKVILNLPCPTTEPHIYVRAEDKEGNNYYLHYRNLNNIKLRKWRPFCGRGKRITKTQQGFEENRNSLLSKKYKIRKSYFDLTIPTAKSNKVGS